MVIEAVVPYIPFVFPAIPAVRCAFATRACGNLAFANAADGERAAVTAARESLRGSLGVDAWTELRQVHGDAFLKNPESTQVAGDALLEADGHTTQHRNHALCIKTADCQAILLAHPQGYIAALHVGWRGNVLRFIQSAVASFCREYGLDPADVCAVRGPSLGYAEFVNFDKEWPPEYAPWYDRKTRCMDLWSLTRHQLAEAGLAPQNVYSLDLCTYSLNEMFFSHRRGDSGRQMAVIWMT